MTELIPRDDYLNRLISLKDSDFIKVLSGIRRSGKSTILGMFKKYLIDSGISEENIIDLNFDSWDLKKKITTNEDLYDLIKDKITNGRSYVLLDEIQNIPEWEDAMIAAFTDMDADFYITGSNAMMNSPNLGTKLVGRFIEIHVYPLSFNEIVQYAQDSDIENLFDNYVTYGGFPGITTLKDDRNKTDALNSIFESIIASDVLGRNDVRDAALMMHLIAFIADNTGNIVSVKSITDYLNSSGKKVTPTTIDNYLLMLEKSFLIYKAKRYDIAGKTLLKTLDKYYLADAGIRNMIAGNEQNFGRVLENIVYIELLRRGYTVYVGKLGQKEVDFVAVKGQKKMYYQVSMTVMDDNTRRREIEPLLKIEDNHPKTLLSMDRNTIDNYSGILNRNIITWLLESDE